MMLAPPLLSTTRGPIELLVQSQQTRDQNLRGSLLLYHCEKFLLSFRPALSSLVHMLADIEIGGRDHLLWLVPLIENSSQAGANERPAGRCSGGRACGTFSRESSARAVAASQPDCLPACRPLCEGPKKVLLGHIFGQ